MEAREAFDNGFRAGPYRKVRPGPEPVIERYRGPALSRLNGWRQTDSPEITTMWGQGTQRAHRRLVTPRPHRKRLSSRSSYLSSLKAALVNRLEKPCQQSMVVGKGDHSWSDIFDTWDGC
ncbi:hypothetical protein Bbelb_039220 [Branchiostoma belcheri]|nr:hypothetical protein Bbelb_039220 [Branchiostoma belcheri]